MAIKTQVCIIGAGPAGAAASITLSRSQVPHLVVEATSFPRHKPCGDIITSGVLRAMNDLDPGILKTLQLNGQLNPIWHTFTYPPNGKPVAVDFLPFNGQKGEPSCYSVSRFEMDDVLVSYVRNSKYATFKENCRITGLDKLKNFVQLTTDQDETIEAEMVIVATGSNNSMLKFLGLNQPKKESAIGIRAHFEGVDCPLDRSELFLDPDLMPGGFYITPLPGNAFNVNLVVSLEKVGKENLNLREVFEDLIQRNPILRQKFAKARRINNFEGSMLFLGIQKRVISGERFMVIGDSAGLIEFFSGNGIPQALLSGKLASLTTVEALKSKDFKAGFLQAYETALYRKILKNYSAGRYLYPLLHKKWLSNRVLRFLNYLSNRPQTNDLLRDLLYEKVPSKKLWSLRFYYNLLVKK